MMNRAPAFAALLLAVSASAQVQLTPEQADSLAATQRKAKTLAERLRPAPVDKDTVSALWSKLSKEGDQVAMDEGIGNVLTRFGRPDASGRFKHIQANLIELPAELVEGQDDSMFRQAVMRRYFSHMVATSEAWSVDEKKATGRVDVWVWQISLDGKLIAVEHQIVPLEPGIDGQLAPNELKGRSYMMSPSDPSVQRRWKAFSKELLLLGRTIEV